MLHSMSNFRAALFLPENIYQETNGHKTKVTEPNAFTSLTLVPESVRLSKRIRILCSAFDKCNNPGNMLTLHIVYFKVAEIYQQHVKRDQPSAVD
jgi:hypothetical protein